MQSSSRLFPVTLTATDMAADLYEDVYLLNPGVSPDPSVRIAVTRIRDPAWEGARFPMVLLHREFQNKRQWLSPGGQGLAAHLARYGFDVWLVEMRGHGMSPRNRDWAMGHIALLAEEDLPPVQRFVEEQSGRPPAWLGQGIGARLLAYAMIHNVRFMRRVPAVVFVDPGRADSHWTESRLSLGERLRLRHRQRFLGGLHGWGPEDEPNALFQDLYRSQKRFRRGKGHPTHEGLRIIRCPGLVVGVEDDEDTVYSFARNLGGQVRHTLGPRDRGRRCVGGQDSLGTALQDDIRAWLSEQTRDWRADSID